MSCSKIRKTHQIIYMADLFAGVQIPIQFFPDNSDIRHKFYHTITACISVTGYCRKLDRFQHFMSRVEYDIMRESL